MVLLIFDEKIIVSGISVFQADFIKKKQVYVPARDCHALTFRLSGSVTLGSADGTRELLSCAGDLTFTPKGLGYFTEVLDDGSIYAVHFTTNDDYEGLAQEVIRPAHPAVLRSLFAELAERFRLGREHDLACMSMFYGILAEARHEADRARQSVSPRMRAARARIDRDYGDPELTVTALAREAGVSEVYFRREFGRCFGMAPSVCIRRVRMENARALLRTGYYSVTETALRCGFDSISYFSCQFHRETGCTPREYIRQFEG